MKEIDQQKLEFEDLYDNIEDDTDEDESEQLHNIKSWGADLSFRELILMYEDDELIKPEIQRHYVWDKAMASRFIESILMGLPVPSIFLSKMKNDKYLIIDGFQRFMSVRDYCSGLFHDKTPFKLTNSKKISPKWRGKSFVELSDDDKRRIRTTTIHAIIFDYNDDTSLFQIFERINTGGRSLSSQEIRNCMYHNNINKLLLELNKDINWKYIYGTDQYDRMNDIEHILRFFALKSPEVKEKIQGQLLLKRYLNEYMGNEKLQKNEKLLTKMEKEFNTTIEYLRNNFDRSIFRQKTFKSSVFDAIAIATSFALENNSNLPSIPKERIEKLLNDKNFIEFSTVRTTNYEHINKRINMATQILYGVSYIHE